MLTFATNILHKHFSDEEATVDEENVEEEEKWMRRKQIRERIRRRK
jgi:hypothetical protein